MARTALLLATVLLGFACAGELAERARLGAGSEAAVYYASVEALPVHAGPSASSPLVGRLALHEKVTRARVERGYAEIRAADRALAGWVDNAHLLWRVPAAGGAAAAKPAAGGGVLPAGAAAPPAETAPATGAAPAAPAAPAADAVPALVPTAPAAAPTATASEAPAPAAAPDPAPVDPPPTPAVAPAPADPPPAPAPTPAPKHEPTRPRPGSFDPF